MKLFSNMKGDIFGGISATIILLPSAITFGLIAFAPLRAGFSPQVVMFGIYGAISSSFFAGGAFQALFGTLRLGSAIKYIPYPIVAGFSNGIAVLLIIGQIRPLLGMSNKTPYWDILRNPTGIQPLTFGVGLFTLFVMFFCQRYIKKVPATLIGLLGGSAFYYTVAPIAGSSAMSSVIGSIEGGFPHPDIFIQLLNLNGGGKPFRPCSHKLSPQDW
ncbi:MAG: SulP family inorganic anion transporter [Syntrophobacteraceae bacterium]